MAQKKKEIKKVKKGIGIKQKGKEKKSAIEEKRTAGKDRIMKKSIKIRILTKTILLY